MPDATGAILAFTAAATLLTITPGLDTAMVLRAAALGGPRPAALAGLGIALGCLAWGALVSLGLAALLTASPAAFTALKWAGAAYLAWLGGKAVLKPRTSVALDGAGGTASGLVALRQGLVTNLLNPKVGVFYLTFLPQFVPPGADMARFSFLLAAIHVLLSLAWFAALIAATVPLGRLLRRPAAVTWLDRLTGCVFLAFGARLALAR